VSNSDGQSFNSEESVKLLQEKTGEEGLLDNVMRGFKKMDLNPFD
jgi:hypothetical protein